MKNVKIETSLFANFGYRKAIKFQSGNDNYIELKSDVSNDVENYWIEYDFYYPSVHSDKQILFSVNLDGETAFCRVLLRTDSKIEIDRKFVSGTPPLGGASTEVSTLTVPFGWNRIVIENLGSRTYVYINNVLIVSDWAPAEYDSAYIGYNYFAAANHYFLMPGFIIADVKGKYEFGDFYKNTTDLSLFNDLVYKIIEVSGKSDIYIFGFDGNPLTAKNDTQEYEVETIHDTTGTERSLLGMSKINFESHNLEGFKISSNSQIQLKRNSLTEKIITAANSCKTYSVKYRATDGNVSTAQVFDSPVNYAEVEIVSIDGITDINGALVSFSDQINGVNSFSISEAIKITRFETSRKLVVYLQSTGVDVEYKVKVFSHRFFRITIDGSIYRFYSQIPDDLAEYTLKDIVLDLYGLEGLLLRRLEGVNLQGLNIPIREIKSPTNHPVYIQSYIPTNYSDFMINFMAPLKMVKLTDVLFAIIKAAGFRIEDLTDFEDIYYRIGVLYQVEPGYYSTPDGADDGVLPYLDIFDKTVLPNITTNSAASFLELLLKGYGNVFFISSSNDLLIGNKTISDTSLTKKLIFKSIKFESFTPETELDFVTNLNETLQERIFSQIVETELQDSWSSLSDSSQIDYEIIALSISYIDIKHCLVIDNYKTGYHDDGVISPSVKGPKSCFAYIDDLNADAKSKGATHVFLKADATKASGYTDLKLYEDFTKKSFRITSKSIQLVADIKGVELEINKSFTLPSPNDSITWIVYKQIIDPTKKQSKIYCVQSE